MRGRHDARGLGYSLYIVSLGFRLGVTIDLPLKEIGHAAEAAGV
jgi:hypothetical protein